MTLTPDAVFRSLSQAFQHDLLALHAIQATEEIQSGNFSAIQRKPRRNLEHDLNCIATLGTDSADPIVHDFLSDAGWTPDDFNRTRSTRERACALLCRFPNDFTTALAIWNGNRLRGKIDREQGFRLPDLTGFIFLTPSQEQLDTLKAAIRIALIDTYPNKVVSRVTLFERAGRGLSTASDKVLQCDISMGEDPETIGIIEGGEETTITITRLATISVIIDTQARSLFVGTALKKKGLHTAIAAEVAKGVLGVEELLDPLKPLRVYPERCKSAVRFSYSSTDGIAMPRISGLQYRLNGTPATLQFSVREEDPEALIHSHPTVQDHARRMRVWRAVIDFEFKSSGDRPVLRRQVTLTEPSGISFGRAFPEERLVIEKVLVQSGLIDADFNWKEVARFSNISRLATPHHEAELNQSWQPLTISNLRDAGIIVPGGPHIRGWCRTCCETHEIERRETDDGYESYIHCPYDPCTLTSDHIDTLELSSEGLISWLCEHAAASDDALAPIGGLKTSVWFLGRAASSTRGKPYDLILAYDVDLAETANALNDFLLNRHVRGPGLILTLTEDPEHKVFPQGWRSTPLSSVCEVTKAGLRFRKRQAGAIVHGRPPEKKQRTDEDWDAILLLFREMYPGSAPLRAYTVANAMIEAEPDLCGMSAANLAPKLKSWAPDRFAE